MPADATTVSLRTDTAKGPAARRDASQEQMKRPPREEPERPTDASPEPERAPESPRRPWRRWALFALLPLALIAGAYGYDLPEAHERARGIIDTWPATGKASMARDFERGGLSRRVFVCRSIDGYPPMHTRSLAVC